MPPPGMPRPSDAAVNDLIAWVDGAFDEQAISHPDPGRVVLHRLNRTEYANVIRDLLSLDVDADLLLPPDNSNDGFDNMADTLTFSPALLEGYLNAAIKISDLAVGDPHIGPTVSTFRVHGDLSQDVHADGLPLGTRGGIAIHYNFPLNGEYVIKTTLMKSNRGLLRGVETPQRFRGDSGRCADSLCGGRWQGRRSGIERKSASSCAGYREAIGRERSRQSRTTYGDGGVHPRELAEKVDMTEPHIRNLDNTQVVIGVPEVDEVSIGGPFHPTGVSDTPSRRRIFTCRPSAGDEMPCARKILTTLARRAYRRPLTPVQTERLMARLVERATPTGKF